MKDALMHSWEASPRSATVAECRNIEALVSKAIFDNKTLLG